MINIIEKEQRIWNEQELRIMPEWRRGEYGDWVHKDHPCWIDCSMVGRTVDSISSAQIVLDYMIAKTDEEKVIIDDELRSEPDFQLLDGGILFNGKHYIEKPKSKTVTLSNGTVLEIGKKYCNYVRTILSATCLAISDEFCWMEIERTDGVVITKTQPIHDKWVPYIEQPAKREWKTFLIESEEYNKNNAWSPARRDLVQMLSIDDVKKLYPGHKITEVKINIEQVNN